jgi:phytoene/squalene synthetase
LAQPSHIPLDVAGDAAEEAPTRTADEENFPVGSWLLPRRLRRHIAIYYAFARAADDIADDPARAPAQKVAELDAMDAALAGAEAPPAPATAKARRLAASLAETGVPIAHGAELLRAFRQDATKLRHGETRATWPASDALCASLQVLNHIQDCQVDYRRLDRVYLPLDAFAAAGAEVAELDGAQASPGVRAVLDRCLDGCAALNREARALPGLIRDTRMRMEAAVIVEISHRLCMRLRTRDPVAHRVELGTADKLACLAGGVWTALW